MTEFNGLEGQLRDFLSDEQKNSHSSVSANFYKYNNLKISMEPKKYSQPHFIVTLGISEAVFGLSDCEKIAGGLGPEERSIYRWFDRAHVQDFLNDLWKKNSKLSPVDLSELDS